MRIDGNATVSMGPGKVATVLVSVNACPFVDATLHGDVTRSTAAYLGAKPFHKSFPVHLKIVAQIYNRQNFLTPLVHGHNGFMPTLRGLDGVVRTVVLVEGVSDQFAVEALAERRGRNLEAEAVAVLPIGGAQAIGRYLDVYGPRGLDLKLAGLCDVLEERYFQRALERAGLGSSLTRADLEALGFYVCVADLEDELIRALGAAAVEDVIRALGHLDLFRTFQKQPAWRERTTEEQLRRFLGTYRGRKISAAPLLVDALDPSRVPRPLDRLLAHV